MPFFNAFLDMPGKFTKPLLSRREYETTTFDLYCQVDDESVEVQWHYNDVEIGKDMPNIDKFEFINEGRDRKLRIKDCPMDFNEQQFKATSDADVTEMKLIVKPLPKIKDAILDKVVKTGKDAVFKCTVDDPEAPFKWYLNGAEINAGEKYSFESDDPCVRKLLIKDCEDLDEGAVAIEFVGGVSSKAQLEVRDDGPPCPKCGDETHKGSECPEGPPCPKCGSEDHMGLFAFVCFGPHAFGKSN